MKSGKHTTQAGDTAEPENPAHDPQAEAAATDETASEAAPDERALNATPAEEAPGAAADDADETAATAATEAGAEEQAEAEAAPAVRTDAAKAEPAKPHAGLRPQGLRRRRGQPDGAGRTTFGLIVIWVCMMLVFYANSQSNTFLKFDPLYAATAAAPDPTVNPTALQRPISGFQRDTTTRQMLRTVAGYLNLTVSDEQLKILGDAGDAVRSVRLEHKPVYSALHEVMNDARFGIGVRGQELLIFEQTLETQRGGNNVQELKWEATLELTEEPMMIFPSGEGDLWFRVRLAEGAEPGAAAKAVLEIEVWRGESWLSMARVDLDSTGSAQLTMSNVENSQFIVRRAEGTEGDAARFKLQFLKQSFSQAKTE